MIGYNKDKLKDVVSIIFPNFETISGTKTKIIGSFYKVLMEFDDTNGIEKEVFFILFTLAFADRKNIYVFSSKPPEVVYNESVIPDINRALYGQDTIRRRIAKPSEIPSWVLYSFEAIGNNNLFAALVTMAIHYNMDLEDMFPEKSKMNFLLNNTSLTTREKFITFKEIKDACENYELKQV